MRRNTTRGEYTLTSVEVRSDLLYLMQARKWNKRKILEEALVALVKPEDLAFMEAVRLEKELEKRRKILDESTGVVKL